MHLMKFKIYIFAMVVGVLGFLLCSSYLGELIYAESPSSGSTESNSGPEANLDYLFAVFFLTWLAFFGYIFFLSRRLKAMGKEILLLKEFIKTNDS